MPISPTLSSCGSCIPPPSSHNSVPAVQGLRPERRRTCRVSRSSHVRNGWRARTRLKDRTISPSWPCTSSRLNAGGVRVYTSYEDSWSTHTPARSQQSAPTSMTLILFFIFQSLCFTTDAAKLLPSSSSSLIIRLTDKAPKEYAVYRSPLLFWGLVDLVYDMFRVSALQFQSYCTC